MIFAQAAFLLGTLAVAVPVLVHLLARPRYRRVPFAMLRFLHLGELESHAKRRLHNWIILAMRCAIVALLALFFAQPALVRAQRDPLSRPHHVLALDNSWSMGYGGYFDAAKAAARSWIEQAPPEAVFDIYPLASRGHAKALERAAALQFVEDTPLSALEPDTAVLTASVRASGEAEQGPPLSLFVASDFTPSIRERFAAVETTAVVDALDYRLIRDDAPSNVAVVDARVEGQVEDALRMTATVACVGAAPPACRIVAKVGGREVARTDARVESGLRTPVSVTVPLSEFPDTYGAVEIVAEPPDALPQDNTFYCAFGVPQRGGREVLVLARDNREALLPKAALDAYSQLNAAESFAVRQVLHNEFFPNTPAASDVLVAASLPACNEEIVRQLQAFFERGGRLICFAGGDGEPLATLAEAGILPVRPGAVQRGIVHVARRTAGSASGDELDPDGALLRALAAYGIEGEPLEGFMACEAAPGSECLWRLDNEEGFIFRKGVGSGSCIFVNTSADGSLGGLLKSPGAVAFCRYLLGPGTTHRHFTYTCGRPVRLPATTLELSPQGREAAVWLADAEGKQVESSIEGEEIVAPSPGRPGWLRTLNTPVRHAGVNAPEHEADVTPPSEEAVKAAVGRAFAVRGEARATLAGERRQATPLGEWFGWAAVGLIVMEAFLSNRMKR